MGKARDGRDARWDEHRIERRAELLRAVIDTIEAEGPDASPEAMAARAGIARPRLYRYFGSNELLREEVIRWTSDRLMERVSPAILAASADDQAVVSVVGAYLDWVAEWPNLTRYCVRHAPNVESLPPDLRERVTTTTGFLLGTARPDLPPAAVPIVVEFFGAAIIGVVSSLSLWWINRGFEPERDVTARLLARQIAAITQTKVADVAAAPRSA